MCENADLLYGEKFLAQIPLNKRIKTVVIAGGSNEKTLASMIAKGLETDSCMIVSDKGWPSTFFQIGEDIRRMIIVLFSLEDPEANEIIGQSSILKMRGLRVEVVIATLSDLRMVRKGLKVISVNS